MLKRINLTTQIMIGMLLGIIVGQVYRSTHPDPEDLKSFSNGIQIFSDIFLRLIKMIIAPLVFSLLLVGIAKVGDFKTVGRIGLKTILYFTFAALLAMVVGLIIVNVAEPGKALNLQQAASDGVASKAFNAREFITHIFPESVVDSMARNQILPIIIFVMFFGIATAAIHEKGKIIIDFFDAVSHVMLKVTAYVMKLAPLGVFGAITAVITEKGLSVLSGYLTIIISFFFGLLIFVFIILFLICLAMRINFFSLLSHVREPMLLAFTTASSEAAMPKTILALERFGCSNRIVSFVLPLGYSFNLDGSILYMIFATISIAQAYGMEISFAQQISMMLILLISSKGMAGVPRASLVVIASMLQIFHIPAEGLTLLLAIDWLLDMGRACTNVIGNAVATAVVSKWEGELTKPEL
ncbi:MAG TPA: cation:dicarboxylase symporter family transporter [Chitinophagales bacterium]|nr:cation:dicarboxylase symporter family transporter [Chitinophagales bacterium]